jgi:hypothetical protein
MSSHTGLFRATRTPQSGIPAIIAAICLLGLGVTVLAPAATAQLSVYRVQGPIEDFFNPMDDFDDTDMLALLLGNRRGENLFEPDTVTDLNRIRRNADSFKGTPVLFIGRFHEIGNLFNPFYTHFTPDEYINFSVWAQHEQLWTQEGVLNDFPYCYLGVHSKMLDRFLSFERLDTVLFKGVSRASLGGEPWIEITGFWPMKGKLTSDDTRAIRRAEDMIRFGDWAGAAAIYTGLADGDLPDVYGVFADKRAAESLLMSGDYRGALRHIKRAKSEAGDAEDIAKLYDKIVHANATGGCEGCPPPMAATGRDSGVGGGLVPSSSPSSMPMSTPSSSPATMPPPAPTWNPPPPAPGQGYTPPSPPATPAQPSFRYGAPAAARTPATPVTPASSSTAAGGTTPAVEQEPLDRPARGY